MKNPIPSDQTSIKHYCPAQQENACSHYNNIYMPINNTGNGSVNVNIFIGGSGGNHNSGNGNDADESKSYQESQGLSTSDKWTFGKVAKTFTRAASYIKELLWEKKEQIIYLRSGLTSENMTEYYDNLINTFNYIQKLL